jgi:hypothetical protein
MRECWDITNSPICRPGVDGGAVRSIECLKLCRFRNLRRRQFGQPVELWLKLCYR